MSDLNVLIVQTNDPNILDVRMVDAPYVLTNLQKNQSQRQENARISRNKCINKNEFDKTLIA